jgi:hypothetical protein
MRFSTLSPLITLLSLFSTITNVQATRFLASSSLNTCSDNSNFTASLFNVIFTPDNGTLAFDVVGISSLTGNFTLNIEILVYGYAAVKKTIDPCTSGLSGLCGMQPGTIDLTSNAVLGDDTISQIPGIGFTVPDLDAVVRININSKTNPDVSMGCIEARLTNGQTVDQKGVSWATAVIAGLALVVSAVVSGLGHSNTAAHIASYALSLFGYFQAMAIVGLTAIPLPPVVQSWTQNFQWTMGIIGVDFMQTIATWYQKSTGGTPATILNTLTTTSVQVMKRSFDEPVVKRSFNHAVRALRSTTSMLSKRGNNQNTIDTLSGTYIVKGIDRVAFRADMESTNVFFTGLAFFCVFVFFTILGVAAFKGFCELAIKSGWIKGTKFVDFRNGWLVVLKGIMYRLVLIGYPQMTILCLWEFTQVDSPAEVVLAVFFFFGMTATLAWAGWKVVAIARRSNLMHKNPAYILYSDPTALNKWGFLYVQFRATAYYYILPSLVYILIKGMFIAFGQQNGVVQAIALIIIEAVVLIAASVLKPWMDKSTNTINIAICAVNFFNTILLLLFADVFDQPALVAGVCGLVFFIVNAIFALVLLIIVIVSTILASIRKNPDTRYQPMSDDRASFIKSQTALTTELDALGVTARGETKGGYKHGLDLEDDDNDSWASESVRRHQAANMPLPPSTANSHNPPHSPVDPSVPLFPNTSGTNMSQTGRTPYQDDTPRAYGGSFASSESRHNSGAPLVPPAGSQVRSASPYARSDSAASGAYRAGSPMGFRGQNTRYAFPKESEE